MNKILKSLKAKYIKDKEFKKEFDKDKEKAIEKYFGKEILKQLKSEIGNSSKASIESFLSDKEELDDVSLEYIAGGKEEKAKQQIVEKHVDVIVDKDINNIKMTPTVKGNLN